VTESDVRELLAKETGPDFIPSKTEFDPTAILIYGGGGHGKSLIDLLRALGVYRIAGLVDDGLEPGEIILGVPVLGGADILPELRSRGVRMAVNAVGGIGDVAVRVKVFQRLAEAGYTCPAVAHPSALIEPSAALSAGVQVFPLAYVGSDARIGFGTIVNTGSILSHDCILGDYVNISPGAILAGAVQVGSGALIGMGVTINLEVRIGGGARIGNGATVKADVPEKGIVRAGAIWPR
jgi:sugar O-acyltransferase (sialic acid O-acetyltransferase NeuD family)